MSDLQYACAQRLWMFGYQSFEWPNSAAYTRFYKTKLQI